MKTADIKKMEFIDIVNDIEKINNVFVINKNFDYCYITFIYKGRLFYLQPSPYYPFTDNDFPTPWGFVVYSIDGINSKTQHSYFQKYESIKSLDNYIYYNKPLTKTQKIDIFLNNYEKIVKKVAEEKGGYREQEIVRNGAFIVKGETWNDKHKVIDILEIKAQSDGHRNGFQIDIITQSICG